VVEYELMIFLIGTGIGYIVAFLMRDKYLERRINSQKAYIEELEVELKSAKNTIYGMKGRQSQTEMNERMEEAISEAMAMFQSGKDPQSIIKEIGAKYPDVAGKLLKKHIFK